MFLSQYDYNLPEELIAKRPQYPRDNSRLLIVNRKTKKIEINNFINIKKFFSSDDLCIFNNTKVLKILLKGKKKNENIREILLISQESSNTWKILTKKPKEEEIDFDKTLKGFLFKRTEEWFITFNQKPDLFIENNGLMPIPPYLDRESDKKDLVDYQTIYASEDGSIAAPTAGLHFTKNYFEDFDTTKDFITLHVGLGTFKPIKSNDLEKHKMHHEQFLVKRSLIDKINSTRKKNNRILSIGTTVVRALESVAIDKEKIDKWSSTSLFIKDDFDFKLTDCLLTNFHLPKSTLLVLVSSFLGYELTMECYQIAIKEKMRFFSYGDAMLIL